MSQLVLLGGGGHARACLDVAETAGIQVVGFLAPSAGVRHAGLDWIGTDEEISGLAAAGARFVVATGHLGDPAVRMKLWASVSERAGRIISPRATVSDKSHVGDGTVVFHHAHVGPDATIGVNVIVNTGAIVEHDACVGDHAHVSTRAVVNGGCIVGSGALVGSGAIVLQGRTVAPGVIVGAGAVVTRDADEGVWAGVPARRIA